MSKLIERLKEMRTLDTEATYLTREQRNTISGAIAMIELQRSQIDQMQAILDKQKELK